MIAFIIIKLSVRAADVHRYCSQNAKRRAEAQRQRSVVLRGVQAAVKRERVVQTIAGGAFKELRLVAVLRAGSAKAPRGDAVF